MHKSLLFDQLTKHLSEGVVIIDKLGIIQKVSDTITDLFHYQRPELLGKNVKILMPESYSKNHDKYIQNYNETGRAKILDAGREVEGQRKDGSTFFLNLKVNEINYEGQSFYMGIIKSLQEQKNTNEKIKHQAELLERAEQIGQLGHWSLDLTTEVLFWSKQVYRIHGLDPETYTPTLESAINFYHPDDRMQVQQKVKDAINNNTDYHFEASIICPTGEYRKVSSSGECTSDASGKVVSVFGTFQDITETTQALDQIEQNNAFLKLVMNSIPDLLFVKDDQFRIVQANDSFINLYPEKMHDKIIGYTTVEEFNKEEADLFLTEDRKAFKNGRSETEENITFPDGVSKTLLTKKVRFTDKQNTNYILGLSRDISQIKMVQNSLLKANQELEEFAYRASHDLRSPLVSSIGILGLIHEFLDNAEYDDAKHSLQLVENSLRKLEDLVKDIPQLTRTKHLEEEKISINFLQIVNEALEKFSCLENFGRLNIITDIKDQDNFLLEHSRIIMIIDNLISNAIKYQDTNKADSFVKISTYKASNNFTFQVEDNGLGIPEQHRDRLFSMFQRFHSKVSFGSGLGLYMMKNSAEILGGELLYEPTEQGSIFKFILKQKNKI